MSISPSMEDAESDVLTSIMTTETMQTEHSNNDSNDNLESNAIRGATAFDSVMILSNSSSLKRKELTDIDESEEEDESATTAQQIPEQRKKSWNKPRTGNNWKGCSSFIKKRKEDRLNGVTPLNQRQPRDFLGRAIRSHESNNPDYAQKLRDLPAAPPNPEQMARLEKSADTVPYYLGRTASLAPGFNFDTWKRSTNGFTTQAVLMPAADTHYDECMHARLEDMSQVKTSFIQASI